MNEKPILFQGRKVRKILDWDWSESDMQARFVIKPQPPDGYNLFRLLAYKWAEFEGTQDIVVGKWSKRNPYGQPGDRLWVREKFSYLERSSNLNCPEIYYWADGNIPPCGDWTKPKPSIFMPRWASRITLEVVNVKVEKVQDITGHDAISEGVDTEKIPLSVSPYVYDRLAINLFMIVWDSINAKRGYGWDKNPWVWVLTYRMVQYDH